MAKPLRALMLGVSPNWVRPLIFLVFAVPILAGFAFSFLAAFGYFPALGFESFSLSPWREALALPGLARSILLTIWVGMASTLFSLAFAMALCSRTSATMPAWANMIIATPHAAIGTSLAFMIAPSGFIIRLLGFDTPPQIASVNDPYGLALILGLISKETPFLWVIMLTAQAQTPARRYVLQGRSFGYSPAAAWLKLAFPVIYPLMRLPIFVVLVFSISVVDMAQILGPSLPPTLALEAMRLYYAPDIAKLLPASVLSILILMISAISAGIWLLGEHLMKLWGARAIAKGGRSLWIRPVLSGAKWLGFSLLAGTVFSMGLLFIWSLAWRWPFPKIFPQRWSLRNWQDVGDWLEPLSNSLIFGLASTLISLFLAIFWLEARGKPRAIWIYIPLILPQISFLFGLNTVFLFLGANFGIWAVIWAHSFFVLPYILIALADPWQNFDARYLMQAASMGTGPWKRLWRVKLPILLAPILLACAIGFAVSIGQYLPTLFFGAGRLESLTTEAVSLSSSGDRRLIGVFGVLQMSLPLLGFWLARTLPQVKFRKLRAQKRSFP